LVATDCRVGSLRTLVAARGCHQTAVHLAETSGGL